MHFVAMFGNAIIETSVIHLDMTFDVTAYNS